MKATAAKLRIGKIPMQETCPRAKTKPVRIADRGGHRKRINIDAASAGIGKFRQAGQKQRPAAAAKIKKPQRRLLYRSGLLKSRDDEGFTVRPWIKRRRRKIKAKRPEFTPATDSADRLTSGAAGDKPGKPGSGLIIESGDHLMRKNRLVTADGGGKQKPAVQRGTLDAGIGQPARCRQQNVACFETISCLCGRRHSSPSARRCAWSSAVSASTTSSSASPATTLSSL